MIGAGRSGKDEINLPTYLMVWEWRAKAEVTAAAGGGEAMPEAPAAVPPAAVGTGEVGGEIHSQKPLQWHLHQHLRHHRENQRWLLWMLVNCSGTGDAALS